MEQNFKGIGLTIIARPNVSLRRFPCFGTEGSSGRNPQIRGQAA